MARQLKRWESPRREGRNDKGRGGAARQRQKKKQFQALRQKLKGRSPDANSQFNSSTQGGRQASLLVCPARSTDRPAIAQQSRSLNLCDSYGITLIATQHFNVCGGFPQIKSNMAGLSPA